MQPIRASIIITNYNYGRFLAQAIDSALGQQEAPPFEVLILDDGSQDESEAVLERYAERKGVRIFRNRRVGIERQTNLGIREARAEFVVRLDADDYLGPDMLSTLVPLLEADPAGAFAYGDYWAIEPHGPPRRVRLPPFDVDEILARGDFLAGGTLYRKAAIEAAGGVPEAVRNCGLENYHLIIKLVLQGVYGIHCATPVFYYRKHDQSMGATRAAEILEYGRWMTRQFGFEYRTNEFRP